MHVTQPAEMSYDSVSLPREVTAGETVSLPANVFNIGKSTLRNVTVNLSGAGLYPTSSVFLGDIQPGQAGYGEMKVFVGMLSMTEGYTESYGRTTGTYVISYTDDAGEIHTVEQQLSTEIKQPVIAGEKTEAEKKAEEEQKRARGICHYLHRRCTDCGRKVYPDDEDEITFLPLRRLLPLWRLFFFNVSRTKYALFAAAMYAALCFSSFANQIRVYDSLLSAFS